MFVTLRTTQPEGSYGETVEVSAARGQQLVRAGRAIAAEGASTHGSSVSASTAAAIAESDPDPEVPVDDDELDGEEDADDDGEDEDEDEDDD